MKTLLFLSIFLFGISSSFLGQLAEKMEEHGVVPGAIINGEEEIQGYIKKTGLAYSKGEVYPGPWLFQSEIEFIPKDLFENSNRIKNRDFDKYRPKNCDGYIYESTVYETVKYADMSEVGINMMPKKMFMKKIIDDNISIFYHYKNPPNVIQNPEGFKPYYIECAKENVVYRNGEDGKLKLLNSMNVQKELEDCPLVVEKFNNGDYDVNVEGENSSGAKRAFNNVVFRDQVRILAIQDYNKNCN